MSVNCFIGNANKIHQGKYNYSKVEYLNNKSKVCIICPTHGEFLQTPKSHLEGHGCPKCGQFTKSKKLISTQLSFLSRAKIIHYNKYDYTNCMYHGVHTKVCIICPTHGEFLQTPHSHLKGHGCPKCANKTLSNEEFVEVSESLYGKYYDYRLLDVTNKKRKDKVRIICPIHGEFEQSLSHHLSGHKCPKCSHGVISKKKIMPFDVFLSKASTVHNHKYDYSDVSDFNGRLYKIKIRCPIHGEFYQNPHDHLCGHGCPKCGQVMSKAEDDIITLLSELQPQQRNRNILDKQEIDIYIPSLKLGIEYNGLRWHSEEFGKDRKYHYNKMAECNSKGIRLIQTFEDEWVNHREVCESKLKHICGLDTDKPKVFARKCLVREITNTDSKEFLERNHIQGFASSTVYLGCYTADNHLVGVMNFKKEKEGFWDLNRFATDINYNCVGIGGKLFKYFTQRYDFQEIKSFADRRWTTDPSNNLYTKLGFGFVGFTKPDYRYSNLKTIERIHKFNCRKQILHRKYCLPLTMTETEMARELKLWRIWDCGLIKYVYKR